MYIDMSFVCVYVGGISIQVLESSVTMLLYLILVLVSLYFYSSGLKVSRVYSDHFFIIFSCFFLDYLCKGNQTHLPQHNIFSFYLAPRRII